MLITTRFIGPTNYRGSRIKAMVSGAGDRAGYTMTQGLDYRLSGSEAHDVVAAALVESLNSHEDAEYRGPLAPPERIGESPDGRGYAYAVRPAPEPTPPVVGKRVCDY